MVNSIFNRNLYIFNKNPIFISHESFKQNNSISKHLRFYVNELIEQHFNKNIRYLVCIGGESYLYGLCNKKIINIFHYTNSQSIYNDVELNCKIYNKYLENKLIDYNSFKKIKNGNLLILNIAKLNLNLLNEINKRFYKYIIIINCHHSEFWERIKYLKKFKIIHRKQFLTKTYFVTVTLLKYIYKQPVYISLGNTCCIAYQLQNLGIRNTSYPFDWCKLNINKLNNVLSNNFKDFEDIEIKQFSENHKYKFEEKKGSYILKNKYNISFAHELYKNNNKDIDQLKKQITKRVNRFLNHKNDYITFIILDIEYKSKLIELVNNLKDKFKSFRLLYINIDNLENNLYTSINNCNINILEKNNYVKCITIDNNIINWNDWTNSKIDWFDIFFN